MPEPLSYNTRMAILMDVDRGLGRNEIARKHGVSTGVVSKIAHRERGYWFPRSRQTELATKARQIDAWSARVEKSAELWNEYLTLPANRVRRTRKVSRLIDNLDRHINNAMYSSKF